MAFKDVMFDLETMSSKSNAAILSIGAVEMDLHHLQLTDQHFYQNIELSSCAELGLHVSESTRDWWATQEPEARDALTINTAPLRTALARLRNWILLDSDHAHVRPWGNGASFDVVILENAFHACNIPVPWEFRNHMCYRTKKNEHKQTVKLGPHIGVKHNALDDAITQARHLLAIYRYERRPRTLIERLRASWSIPTQNTGPGSLSRR